LTSHLHYKLTCCTDSPRPPGVDPPPARSNHALPLSMMRRHTPSHEEGASRHCRNSSSGSSTNEAPFRSTFSRKKGDAPSCAELPSRRSFDAPKPVPRNPAQVKHFAILEENHIDPLNRRATADPPDGRTPPGGMVTLPGKRRTTSDSSTMLDLDHHRRTIGERKQKMRLRLTDLVTSMVRVRRQSPIHPGKTQEPL
jgi:hypothetical protein